MTVEIDGANNIIKTNTISEVTSANGITIDGLNIKDSKLVTADSVIEANMSANSVDSDSYVDGSIDTVHIGATQITGAKLNNDVISAQTALASEPADTDEFMVSDGGVLKRIDYSLIKGGGGLIKLAHYDVSSTVSTITFDSVFFIYLCQLSSYCK